MGMMAMTQIALCFQSLPRKPKRETVCAAATLVTLDGETKPALVWATERGLKWQTVKMRRMRGSNWHEALSAERRDNPYMSRFSLR